MEESPPKRRRVSPRTSAATSRDATTPPGDQASRSRPKRPSFASPTKASLSRHNPQILERRRSTSPEKPQERMSSAPRRRRSNIEGGEQRVAQLPSAALASVAENVPASDPGPEADEEAREEAAAPSSGRSVRRLRGGLAAMPRRSPAKPSPRPLPPPGPDAEDELSPFVGRSLRRSPLTGLFAPSGPQPEPELPPSVPDPISSTPPRGIHSSSPSRWREKSKPKKSSPLKQPPVRPSRDDADDEPRDATGAARGPRRRSRLRETTALDTASTSVRNARAFDPHAGRKRERDALREEIEKLNSDLDIAHAENKRIRLMQSSGRTLAPSNEDVVLDLVERRLTPWIRDSRQGLSQLLAQAALNPSALLPFAKAVQPPPSTTSDLEKLPEIKSHHPVSMTAEAELPYLQLFSPFDVTSSVVVLPSTANHALRQLHVITLRSREHAGLFTSRIELVVDAMDLAIIDLKVDALEPTSKPELMPFVDRICSGDCNRSMQRNVGVISWAMADWLQLALRRAMFWSRLDRELGSKEQLLETVAATRERSRPAGHDEEDSDDDSEADPRRTADLLRFMGQQHFDINVPSEGLPTTVRLEWKIGFDWTGEGQSKIKALIGLPGKWHHADKGGSLGKLPKLFEDLVQQGEKASATVRTLVALLAGE